MKYLVSGVADSATLDAVFRAFGGEVTVAALPGASKPIPVAEAARESDPPAAKKRTVKRTRSGNGNGSGWPAEGSIYDTVLKSIQGEPKTPAALRDVLVAGGFSPGSVNSALGRLEKAGKAKKGAEGWMAA